MQNTLDQRRGTDDLDSFIHTFEELISLCASLREENVQLREQCQRLNGEKGQLAQVNERSRQQLEATIARLKDLEEEL